jgi:hypothetical protein
MDVFLQLVKTGDTGGKTKMAVGCWVGDDNGLLQYWTSAVVVSKQCNNAVSRCFLGGARRHAGGNEE